MAELLNLKLSQRLILSVLTMAAAMGLMVVGGYLLAHHAVYRMARIHNQVYMKTVAGAQLAQAYSQELPNLVNKLISGAYPWEVGLPRLEEIGKEINSNMAVMSQPPLDMDEVQLLKDIQNKDNVLDTFTDKLKLVLQKGDRKALGDLSRQLYPSVDPLGFRIQHFLQYELARSETLVEANQDHFQRFYGLMVLLDLTAVFFLFMAVAGHLRRTVSTPLGQLVKRMKSIAQGEGDLTRRLEEQGMDEIGEVARAFNAYMAKLQTVDEMKTDLISVTSHQLKTPVAEINGFIENLLMGLAGKLTPRQTEYLEDMRRIGQDNYKLICDLLSVSKIERGVVSVDLKPVHAGEVVALALRDYEPLLEQKGLDLLLDGLEEDALIYADKDKLVEVLRNLLNNAVKCTDRGLITIRTAAKGDWESIEVSDTGIGMDGETLKRLFTKNRILGHEAHRSGAGLGLYISKNFMQMQHGDIQAASEPGKGSRFTLRIPLCKQEKGVAA